MSNFYGYVDLTAGQDAKADIGAGGLGGVLIGNESGLTVVVKLQGANISRSLYPGTVDFFPIPTGTPFNGNIIFSNDAKLSNVASWPASFLQIDTFGPGERPAGVYPMALPRNSNIGNAVNTVGGTALAIQNDNNTIGTLIAEATVVGDTTSAVSLTNDAQFSLGSTLHPAQFILNTSFGQIIFASNGNVTIPARIVANLIQALTGNDIGFHVGAGQRIVDTVNGVDIFQSSASGAALLSGTLTLPTGGWTGPSGDTMARVGDTAGTGSGTFNHNLGAVPDFVSITTHATNNQQSVGYNSETSTQLHVNTGGGLTWFAFLSKRT